MEIFCCVFLIFGVRWLNWFRGWLNWFQGWLNLGFRCNFMAGGGKAAQPLLKHLSFLQLLFFFFFVQKLRQSITFGVWGRNFTLKEVVKKKNLPSGVFIFQTWDIDTLQNSQTQRLILGFTSWTHKKTFLCWIYYLRLWFPCSLHSLSSFLSFPPSGLTHDCFCCFFHLHWIRIPIFWCILTKFW